MSLIPQDYGAFPVPPVNSAVKYMSNYTVPNINVNSANTDVATFTGLPSKYILRRIVVHTPSAAVTTATIDVRTAAGGGGTALVAAFNLSGLTTTASFVDATPTPTTTSTVRTETSLIIRNVTAEGSARTVSITLEIEPL